MTPSIKQILQQSGLERAEARYLLQALLNVNHAWLIAHDQETLSSADLLKFQSLCARRLNGEPIAYILGHREFMGLNFSVSPAVLIPRPETELLVERALTHIAHLEQPKVIDLGCGSGAIGIAIAHVRPDAQVWCSDISQEALDIAKINAQNLNTPNVTFLKSSWWQDIPSSLKFDLAVSNPPYIDKNDHHLQQGDLRFEPLSALTDHNDGLEAIRQIMNGAPGYLKPNAYLCFEHGWDQALTVRNLFSQKAWIKPHSLRDLADIERITEAQYR